MGSHHLKKVKSKARHLMVRKSYTLLYQKITISLNFIILPLSGYLSFSYAASLRGGKRLSGGKKGEWSATWRRNNGELRCFRKDICKGNFGSSQFDKESYFSIY